MPSTSAPVDGKLRQTALGEQLSGSKTNTQLSSLSAEQVQALCASVRSGDYNLFLGAGINLDAKNGQGVLLPSGTTLKTDLCELTGARPSSTLQRVFGGLKPNQVQEQITDRFVNCTPGPGVKRLPTFVWKRIFTLNVDDVIENLYSYPGNLQKPVPFHFKDTFQEPRTLEEVSVIHLHGWAKSPDKGYVFARSEYARLMTEPNSWMIILADIMPVEPFIISGTTLDEIDLEFYLARRNSTSARGDRGPSFFVEPFPDSQTADDCLRHGLTLYHGTFEQFLEELDSLNPNRLSPYDLIASETIDLFPANAPQSVVLGFANDFERVPSSPPHTGQAIKFAYGNAPEWGDLASNWDVGRTINTRLRSSAEAMLSSKIPDRIIVVCDDTGVGKTTSLRRVAYDLATTGAVVLDCTALSRVDPRATSEAIDLIDEPLYIFIDNFAEQAPSIAATLNLIERQDVVFICAERNYRKRHIVRSLGDIPYKLIDGMHLVLPEASQLVQSYVKRGLSGAELAHQNPSKFANRLVNEPIAVACCHILNDMRPLDSIVQTTYDAATESERLRYLIAALGHYCFSGGVRYEVLAACTDRAGWNEQFQSAHPLPLSYFDSARNFIIPLNATLAERTLSRAPAEEVAKAFERLALGIAPRVNRETIRRRAPEARLAGRLFDYEDVIKQFLEVGAGEFYAKVKPSWQWNSRYWEQVALYNLAQFWRHGDVTLLQQAVQHARHAVAIEPHPFPLTTLGKVLFAQLDQPGMSKSGVYGEAQSVLERAIEDERLRSRASVHAYVTLFRGSIEYLQLGGTLTEEQSMRLETMMEAAARYFPRDIELRELSERLLSIL